MTLFADEMIFFTFQWLSAGYTVLILRSFRYSYPMSLYNSTSVFSARKVRHQLSASGFALFAIIANLLNLVFYWFEGLYASAWMELAGIAVLFLCVWLNNHQQYKISKPLSLLIVNFQVAYLSAIQGVSGGAYLYLFPYILSLLFFLRLNKQKTGAIFPLGITILTLLALLLFAPYRAELEAPLQQQLNNHYYLNIIVTFLLTITFFLFAISFLRSKERKLTTAKKFRDTIFNTSSDAIIIINLQQDIIVDCNDKAMEMFGLHRLIDEKGTVSSWNFLREPLYRQIPDFSAVSSGADLFWQGDLEIRNAAGNMIHTLTSVVQFTHDGVPYRKISFLDITRQKEASMEILKARDAAEKALNVRTRFLSNMSHELRTPLNGIIGASGLVADQHPHLKQDDYFSIIRNASQHMLTLVNQVLDYSKLESDQFQLLKKPFLLRKTIEELIQSFRWDVEEKDLRIEYHISSGVPDTLMGDPLRLIQVLMNLLSNAIKFSAKGIIQVKVSLAATTSKSHVLLFEVADNGIGIAKGKEQSVFEGFVQADAETTRKYGGTGLGLTISRELVRRMNGDIAFRANEPVGTVFYFTLPFELSPQQAREAQLSEDEKIISLSGKKVLLVEDNPVNMLVAKKILEKWGAHVTEAIDGKKGWQAFSATPFDILLIDLEMPEMDGSELIREVRHINPHIPAIAFTAATYDNIFDDLSKKGFSAFVPKPFVPHKLNHTIARLLQNEA
jgi:signal transduction histidine kinase/CheY-like chemotaxis protein